MIVQQSSSELCFFTSATVSATALFLVVLSPDLVVDESETDVELLLSGEFDVLVLARFSEI